mmetsp:Transcript_37329/g.101054  ORF Transcript_37329/g.101054 Transcript_37329/m.101054 type:complete len:300 (+) Transcript_37329:165-1064(+)
MLSGEGKAEHLEAHGGDLLDDRRVVAVPPAAVDVQVAELVGEHNGLVLVGFAQEGREELDLGIALEHTGEVGDVGRHHAIAALAEFRVELAMCPNLDGDRQRVLLCHWDQNLFHQLDLVGWCRQCRNVVELDASGDGVTKTHVALFTLHHFLPRCPSRPVPFLTASGLVESSVPLQPPSCALTPKAPGIDMSTFLEVLTMQEHAANAANGSSSNAKSWGVEAIRYSGFMVSTQSARYDLAPSAVVGKPAAVRATQTVSQSPLTNGSMRRAERKRLEYSFFSGFQCAASAASKGIFVMTA